MKSLLSLFLMSVLGSFFIQVAICGDSEKEAFGTKKDAFVLVTGFAEVDYSNLSISAKPETEAFDEILSKKKKYTLVSISNDGKVVEERKLDFLKKTAYIKCAIAGCKDHRDSLWLRVFLKKSPVISKVRLLQKGKVIAEALVKGK